MRPAARRAKGDVAAARMAEETDRARVQRGDEGAEIGDMLGGQIAGVDPVPALGIVMA